MSIKNNLYTEIQVNLFPAQPSFAIVDEAALARVEDPVRLAFEAVDMKAIYRTPAIGQPLQRFTVVGYTTRGDRHWLSHGQIASVRNQLLAIPWVGEAEVLGACRV